MLSWVSSPPGNVTDLYCIQHSTDSTELRPAENNKFQSLLSGVNCSGSEKRLADCHHDGVDLGDTRGCKWAYVRCLYTITTGIFKILNLSYVPYSLSRYNTTTNSKYNHHCWGSSYSDWGSTGSEQNYSQENKG